MRRPVLIPRPETADLVDKILECTPSEEKMNFLEVGVGTGAISLSILKKRPLFTATAIDIAHEAVELSKVTFYHHKTFTFILQFKKILSF